MERERSRGGRRRAVYGNPPDAGWRRGIGRRSKSTARIRAGNRAGTGARGSGAVAGRASRLHRNRKQKCRGGDLNPYSLRNQILSLACLPISPPRRLRRERFRSLLCKSEAGKCEAIPDKTALPNKMPGPATQNSWTKTHPLKLMAPRDSRNRIIPRLRIRNGRLHAVLWADRGDGRNPP